MTELLIKSIRTSKNIKDDFETLKLMISYCIGTEFANGYAKRLLKEYGTLETVLSSNNKTPPTEQNRELLDELFKFKKLIDTLLRFKIVGKPITGDLESVANYYKSIFLGKTRQEFHVLFMNDRNHLIADECMQIGTVNVVSIYPREIIKLAFKYNSTKILIIRNQPGRYAIHNSSDVTLIKQINKIATYVNLKLLDYLIIGDDNDYCFIKKKLFL